MSADVRVWEIRQVKREGRPVRFELRWTVDGKQHSKTYISKQLAKTAETELRSSVRDGADFDPATGRPRSQSPASGPTCYAIASEMMRAKWAGAAGKSRVTEVDNLSRLLCWLIPTTRVSTRPDALRAALRATLGREAVTVTPEQTDALRWLERASLPVDAIDDDTVRTVLAQASTLDTGKPGSESIRKQRRVYLSGMLEYAVQKKHIKVNPVAGVKPKESERAGSVTAVTKRQIGDLPTARRIIEAMPAGETRDFVTTVLLAGMRPSEVAAVRPTDCTLPAEGWGELELAKSAATAGAAWTDSGQARDDRGLKHRTKKDRRTVPIPPQLVTVLSARAATLERGVSTMFPGKGGEHAISEVTIGRHWKAAREAAGVPDDTLPRVYDLRHLAASLWLNAGVPVVEVAARLGHSPAVLLNVYAHVVTTERPRWNSVIEAALDA